MEVTYEGPEGAMIGDGGRQPVMFQQVAELPPRRRWPDPAYPQQLHLDITVGDLDEAEQARWSWARPGCPATGENWRVYADPHGHPFCLMTGGS